MASIQEHLGQHQHNRELLGELGAKYPDWILTVAFYTALHAVDALFEHDQVPGITSHDDRNRVLRENRRYLQIWRHYRPFYDASRRVRYLTAARTTWIPYEKLDEHVMRRWLYPIEKSVWKLMGKAEGPGVVRLRQS